jgi:Flp pilus assembly protein TadG
MYSPNASLSEPRRHLTRLLPALLRDKRGAAAVEFAVLAPLLTLMLLGTIELARAINIDRVFTTTTDTIADLVGREQYMGATSGDAQANLSKMMDAVKQIMLPYDSSSFKAGVMSVQVSPTNANDSRVVWSYSYNNYGVLAKCSPYTLPAGLVAKGGSVIVVESNYTFKPLFSNIISGWSAGVGMPWTGKSFHSPRNSCTDYVKGDNCSSLSC